MKWLPGGIYGIPISSPFWASATSPTFVSSVNGWKKAHCLLFYNGILTNDARHMSVNALGKGMCTNLTQCLQILGTVHGLGFMHSLGVVHGDIKAVRSLPSFLHRQSD
jgi:hypothetical protein